MVESSPPLATRAPSFGITPTCCICPRSTHLRRSNLPPPPPDNSSPLADAQMAYTRTILSSLPLTISVRGSHRCGVPSRPPETMGAVCDVGVDGWGDGQRGEADSRAKLVRHEKRGSACSCWYTTHLKSYQAEKKGRAREMAKLSSDQCFRVIAVH